MIRATLLLVTSWLSGCAAAPAVVHDTVEVPVVKYETVPIPDVLLRPCAPPKLELKTNGDLEAALAAALLRLKACSDDKAAIASLQ